MILYFGIAMAFLVAFLIIAKAGKESEMNEYIVEIIYSQYGEATVFKEKLIRCKDCKHRPKVIEGCVEIDGFSLEFPDFECPCHCNDPYYSWMPKDDWHCGNGERKE